jgi:hypothetical protein
VASEELETVRELLRGIDLESLSIAERRAATESVAAQPPPGTAVALADAGGVPAEWVVAAGVPAGRVLVYLHGGTARAVPTASKSRSRSGPRCRMSGTRSLGCCLSPTRRSNESAAGSRRTTRAADASSLAWSWSRS